MWLGLSLLGLVLLAGAFCLSESVKGNGSLEGEGTTKWELWDPPRVSAALLSSLLIAYN